MRHYRYFLSDNDFNEELLTSTLSLFLGKHDFSSFARIEHFKNPVRTIDDIKITKKNNIYIIDFFAQTFLWQQIRRIIGAVVKVQKGSTSNDAILECLQHPEMRRDFGLAPSHPLFLMDIKYPFNLHTSEEGRKKLLIFEKTLIASFLDVF
jgi:tRNA pseudouridine38-40 synthase